MFLGLVLIHPSINWYHFQLKMSPRSLRNRCYEVEVSMAVERTKIAEDMHDINRFSWNAANALEKVKECKAFIKAAKNSSLELTNLDPISTTHISNLIEDVAKHHITELPILEGRCEDINDTLAAVRRSVKKREQTLQDLRWRLVVIHRQEAAADNR